jgi:hypothetical protein
MNTMSGSTSNERALIALPGNRTGGDCPGPVIAAESSPKPAIERVNLVLARETIDALDAISTRILKDTGSHVNRSQLVRAMVAAHKESGIIFVGCRTESDIKTVVKRIYRDAGRMIAGTEVQRPR